MGELSIVPWRRRKRHEKNDTQDQHPNPSVVGETATNGLDRFDAVVVGGGPAGSTAAHDLARQGRSVLLIDRPGRIKPCGGAVPPRLLRDFDIPDHLVVARATSARIVSPSDRRVLMPIDDGFVGMVDRESFDDWLRRRAEAAGAVRLEATVLRFDRDPDGTAVIHFETGAGAGSARARAVIGADGARSAIARQCIEGAARARYVFAYHEIVRSPEASEDFEATRCDVYYRGTLSPDFYGWIFPHGATTSVGTGSARKGFGLRAAVLALRGAAGLAAVQTLRREGAPIPLHPLPRWDNGRDVVLAGDAAGVVAPASGEGIYYAMLGGRLAAEAVHEFCATDDARALGRARKRFMREHGGVFRALGLMQRFWYANDWLRERFVALCGDRDIQRLVWDAYLNKSMGRASPSTYARIMLRNVAQLLVVRPRRMIHPSGQVGPPVQRRCTDSSQTEGVPSV